MFFFSVVKLYENFTYTCLFLVDSWVIYLTPTHRIENGLEYLKKEIVFLAGYVTT